MYICLPLLGYLEHFLYTILYCMIDLTGYFYYLSLQNNYGKVRGICPPNNFTIYLSFYIKKCHVFEIWRWNQCIFYILSLKSVVNPQNNIVPEFIFVGRLLSSFGLCIFWFFLSQSTEMISLRVTFFACITCNINCHSWYVNCHYKWR